MRGTSMKMCIESRQGWKGICLAMGLALAPAAWAENSGAATPGPATAAPADGEAAPADQPAAEKAETAHPPAPVPLALAQLAQAPASGSPAEAEGAGSSDRAGGIRLSITGELLGWATVSGSMKQGIFSRNN